MADPRTPCSPSKEGVRRIRNASRVPPHTIMVLVLVLVLVLGAGCWVLGAGCWVLGAWCWVRGAGCWVLSAGCWVLGSELSVIILSQEALLSSRRHSCKLLSLASGLVALRYKLLIRGFGRPPRPCPQPPQASEPCHRSGQPSPIVRHLVAKDTEGWMPPLVCRAMSASIAPSITTSCSIRHFMLTWFGRWVAVRPWEICHRTFRPL